MPKQQERSTATKRLSVIRKKREQNKKMIIMISFVVIAFCVVLGAQMIKKYNTLSDLKEQEAKLQRQYKKELQLSEELKDKEAYVKTDDYIEEMARNLGLLYPNEVIFKPED